MTAKLVKTEAVVEGRTEVRWTLVEDDDTPEFEEGSATHPIGDPTPQDHGPGAHDRHGPLHGRRCAARACSRPPCSAARTRTPR